MTRTRDAAKAFFLGAATLTGATALARRRSRKRLRILAYHGVDRTPDALINFDGFHVTPAVFREHLEILARRCHVLPLIDAVSRLVEGKPLPDHAAVITFDDGYLNNLEIAAPILREFGLPATFFVTTGYMDGTHRPWWFDVRQLVSEAAVPLLRAPDGVEFPLRTNADRIRAMVALEETLKRQEARARAEYMAALVRSCGSALEATPFPLMSPDDVRRLVALGFDVGPHTVSHLSMGIEDESAVLSEIKASAQRIISVTGQRSRCYSYPYGRPEDLSMSTVRILKEEGFLGALTTAEGMNGPDADAMKLARLNVTGRHGRRAFEALVTGLTLIVRGDSN